MKSGRTNTALMVILWAMTLLPAAARAQSATSGAIAGEVKDTTGAVLPGVTVEAASPALIEKVRTVVTDDQGQYKIVDLRPGTYTVTFTLAGFNTVKREGIELTTGFTALANAELRVGALEETITVSGASPVVDAQNVRSQNVLSRAILDAVPTSKSFSGVASLTVGAFGGGIGANNGRDVGGSSGDWGGFLKIHGGRTDGVISLDGMPYVTLLSEGFNRTAYNQAAVQEMVVSMAGSGAEAETGGVSTNVVPKDGGNRFSGVLHGDYTGKKLQSDNLSPELATRGVTKTNPITKMFDVYGGVGGPLIKDKLWFYDAHRRLDTAVEQANVYYNRLQGMSPFPNVSSTLFYDPDLSHPGHIDWPQREFLNLRVTWQAAQRHKVTVTGIVDTNLLIVGLGPTRTPEAAWWGNFHERAFQTSWTHAATNKLLFEAAYVLRDDTHINIFADESRVTANDRAIFNIATGQWYGSHASGANPSLFNASGWLNDYGPQVGHPYSSRASMSYVTGSHAFKVGYTDTSGFQNYGPGKPNLDEAYQFRGQTPIGLWQLAGPGYGQARLKMSLGIFAQDQWTLRKLTLNLGVRFDYINAYNPEQVRPAGKYTPEIRSAPVLNVPNWKDISPRIGGAYDLFGNGKTAIKASLGTYMSPVRGRLAQLSNPSEAIAGTVFRTWNDANGDYVPDCDLKSPLANGECGAMANNRFGTPFVTRRFDPDYVNGWGKRPYNWQGAVSVQQELRSGMAVDVGYFRTWYSNFPVADNQAVTPADYDPFCLTLPRDPRLPGGGGNQLCGFYDLRPEKFGQVDEVYTLASHFGKASEVFNGVDMSVRSRFGRNGLLSGGVSLGKTKVNNCLVVDYPGGTLTGEFAGLGSLGGATPALLSRELCRYDNPQHQIKAAVAYPLPWGVQASGVWQNLPGVNRLLNYAATNAEIAPSLGRNLGACGTSVTCNATVAVDLIAPNSLREPRQNQVDVRLSKVVRLGAARLQPKFDIYNLFNANDVQLLNSRYGATWLNASAILVARTFKFGAQLDF